jgi:hypothetical protein
VLLNREASGALWEREDLPPGIERDLDRRNVVPVLISDSIAEVLGVQLVDSDTLPGPGAWYMPDRAVWRWSVSMPGYSTDGRYALVITAVGCGGGLCGMASGVLLERVRQEWRVVRHVGTLTF